MFALLCGLLALTSMAVRGQSLPACQNPACSIPLSYTQEHVQPGYPEAGYAWTCTGCSTIGDREGIREWLGYGDPNSTFSSVRSNVYSATRVVTFRCNSPNCLAQYQTTTNSTDGLVIRMVAQCPHLGHGDTDAAAAQWSAHLSAQLQANEGRPLKAYIAGSAMPGMDVEAGGAPGYATLKELQQVRRKEVHAARGPAVDEEAQVRALWAADSNNNTGVVAFEKNVNGRDCAQVVFTSKPLVEKIIADYKNVSAAGPDALLYLTIYADGQFKATRLGKEVQFHNLTVRRPFDGKGFLFQSTFMDLRSHEDYFVSLRILRAHLREYGFRFGTDILRFRCTLFFFLPRGSQNLCCVLSDPFFLFLR